jgi:hypothetical protein
MSRVITITPMEIRFAILFGAGAYGSIGNRDRFKVLWK